MNAAPAQNYRMSGGGGSFLLGPLTSMRRLKGYHRASVKVAVWIRREGDISGRESWEGPDLQ